MEDILIEGTQGTNPMLGIDLEPDRTPYGYLERCVLFCCWLLVAGC